MLEPLDEGLGRGPGTQEADPVPLPGVLRLGGERRGEEHRSCASEERTTIDHWGSPQASCGRGLYEKQGKPVGSMREPSSQAGRSVAERRCQWPNPAPHSRVIAPILDALAFT